MTSVKPHALNVWVQMTQSILKRFSYLLNLTRTMFLFFNTPSVKTAMYVSLLFLLRKFAFPSGKNPRGEFPYESDGMFRLALGSEISDFGLTWGVWDGTLLYLPIQVSIRAVHKEINEKYRDFWSPLGVSLCLSHTRIWSPFNFPASIPVTFTWELLTASAHMSLLVMWICFFSESKQKAYYVMGTSQRSLPRSRFFVAWHPKNGCEGDYSQRSSFFLFLLARSSIFAFSLYGVFTPTPSR